MAVAAAAKTQRFRFCYAGAPPIPLTLAPTRLEAVAVALRGRRFRRYAAPYNIRSDGRADLAPCVDVLETNGSGEVGQAAILRERRMFDRRGVLAGMGSALAFAVSGLAPRLALSQERPPIVPGLPAGVYDTAMLDTLPGKQPLIKLSYRLPNYETPVSYFKTAITPNDAFFVRYHLADIPETIDPMSWRLQIGGEAAATPLQLTLQELQTG